MKRIICWLIGHNWFTTWPKEIRFQIRMKTFRTKICIRCGKVKQFDIQKAKKPSPPINCNQEMNWKSYSVNLS